MELSVWFFARLLIAAGLFFVAAYLFIPMLVKSYRSWKLDRKTSDLASVVSFAWGILAILLANLLLLLQVLTVDSWVLSILDSFLFLGMFFLSVFLCIPKSVQFWEIWQKTGKIIHL